MKRWREIRLETRLAAVAMLALAVFAIVILSLLGGAYNREVEAVARTQVTSELPLVTNSLDELRLRDLRFVQLIAADPAIISATQAKDRGRLDKLVGPLRGSLSPSATILAVVDPAGQTLSTDPFTDRDLRGDGPVQAALKDVRQTNPAGSRNVELLSRNAFPPLSMEAAWPIAAQAGRPVGALVLLSGVTDATLDVLLTPRHLQGAIILPRQRTLLAATPQVRALQQRMPGFFSEPSQAGAVFQQAVTGGSPIFFAAQTLSAQPAPAVLLVGVPSSDLRSAEAAQSRRLLAISGIALVILGLILSGTLRLALRPLRRLSREAAAVAGEAQATDAQASGAVRRREPFSASAVERLPIKGPREIVDVSDALRRLAEKLSQAERDRREQREHIEAIIDSMAEGVVVSDVNRRVTLVNPVAKRLLGISGADAVAFSGDTVPVHPVVKNPVGLTANSKVIKSRSAPILAETGRITGYVTLLHDASQEAELDRLKSEFVGVISHELRTPLTSIKGSIDLLLDDDTGEINATQRRFLSTIRRSSDRLINLVSDLLDLSGLEAGRVQLDCHPVDLKHLIEDVLTGVGNIFVSKKQLVRSRYEPDLRPVRADRQRIEQVLVNLLGNASKYTPEGGEVMISAREEGNQAVVDVADTGPGLTPRDLEHIFEKFYRAGDALTQQQAGSGLGLAIVQSLVHLHGGEIWVRSEPGQGSVFSISLPVYDEEE